MWSAIVEFLSSEGFQPHGYCLMWQPDIFWLHVFGDLLIALSYFSIPAAIIVFSMRRRGLGYRWVYWIFGAFVAVGGITHLFSIVTLWMPFYGFEALLKLCAALISAATAIALWRLLPKALAVPTIDDLEELVRLRTEDLVAANRAYEAEISERIAAQRRLNVARTEAVEANNAKSRFLSVMSHELRTPLNAILGFAQLIEANTARASSDKIKDFADSIIAGGSHLLKLVEEILDLSSIDAGSIVLDLQPVSCADAIAEVSEGAKTIASQKGITVSVDIENHDQTVIADKTRLRQILLNLVSN